MGPTNHIMWYNPDLTSTNGGKKDRMVGFQHAQSFCSRWIRRCQRYLTVVYSPVPVQDTRPGIHVYKAVGGNSFWLNKRQADSYLKCMGSFRVWESLADDLLNPRCSLGWMTVYSGLDVTSESSGGNILKSAIFTRWIESSVLTHCRWFSLGSKTSVLLVKWQEKYLDFCWKCSGNWSDWSMCYLLVLLRALLQRSPWDDFSPLPG